MRVCLGVAVAVAVVGVVIAVGCAAVPQPALKATEGRGRAGGRAERSSATLLQARAAPTPPKDHGRDQGPLVPITFQGVEPDSPEGVALDFLAKLRDGDVLGAATRFDDVMWSSLMNDGLLGLWPSLVGEGGAFRGIARLAHEGAGWSDVVHVVCRFDRGEIDVRVDVTKAGRIHGLSFAQPEPAPYEAPAYVNAAAVQEKELTVGEVALPALLTTARQGAAMPAVLLVHGSGPLDRDERMGSVRPFRDLALGLASRGVAVLRYDKRTLHLASKLSAEALDAMTLEQESIADARAAVAILRTEPRIDAQRIFLLGHSLGTAAVLRLAASEPQVAGLVLLAPPARPLEDVIADQVRYLARLSGPADESGQQLLAKLAVEVERVKTLTAGEQVAAADLPLGIPAAYWLDLAAHPVLPLAAQEHRPVLLLQGGRDYQVTGADFALWQQVLGRSGAELRFYPELDHAFVSGRGLSSPADYNEPGHVDGRVVQDVAQFILASRGQ